MISEHLARGSFARRIVTRAVVVLGAVFVGGQVMRTLPHDQTLVFPVGSTFPNAKRFAASWKQAGDSEPRGGVTLSFDAGPPLQIRQHAKLPNGDYIVAIDILEPAPSEAHTANPKNTESSKGGSEGLQTNIERRVNLVGGETVIVLASPSRDERF